LTLRGVAGKTRLIITDPAANAITVKDCRDVSLIDLQIDYDPAPFSQGTVAALDLKAGWFEVELDPDYLPLDHEAFKRCTRRRCHWGIPATRNRYYGYRPVWPTAWEKQKGRRFRVVVEGGGDSIRKAGIAEGVRYVNLARGGGNYTSQITAIGNTDLSLRSIHIYAGPGCDLMLMHNEGRIEINGLRVEPLPGSNRILSSCADGIHALGNRDPLLISNCHFAGMADDAINIHTRCGGVSRVVSKRELEFNNSGTCLVRKGDLVAVLDPESGGYRLTAKVIKVDKLGGVRWGLTLDKDIPALKTGKSWRDADWLLNLDTCAPGSIIRNNFFGPFRGRGIVLRSTGTLIEDNTFEVVSGLGITLLVNTDWGEGSYCRDVTIRNNSFRGVSRTISRQAIPAITSGVHMRKGGRLTVPVHKNVSIENNRFVGLSGSSMMLGFIAGLKLSGNTTDNSLLNRVSRSPVAHIQYCTDILVDGDRVVDHNPETTAGYSFKGCLEKQVRNTKFDLRKGCPEVQEVK